jgi:hypothetical protein
MSDVVVPQLPAPITQNPFILPTSTTGVITLGAANKSAIKRLANHAQAYLKSGEPLPISPFCELIADKISGTSKQDSSLLLSGRRGSGKSLSALYIALRVSEALSRKLGGTPSDYFTLENCAVLDDETAIGKLLEKSIKHQIIIVDDSSVAINSRAFASSANRQFNKIFTVCRTQRWFLIFTTPIRSHIDLSIRQMVDFTGTVYKSFHAGSFNILKIHSVDVSEHSKNKEYVRRLTFDKQKIDFWVAFHPGKELSDAYDVRRDAAALRIIAEEPGTKPKKSSGGMTKSEMNLMEQVKRFGPAISKMVVDDPDVKLTTIADKLGQNYHLIRRIAKYDGIPIKEKGVKQK